MKSRALRFSVGWSAALLVIQGAAAALFIFGMRSPPREGSRRYALLNDLDRASAGWLSFLIFGTLAAFLIFRCVICVWRFFSDKPALIINASGIALHASYLTQASFIPASAIGYVFFGRANRPEYWESFGWISHLSPPSGRWGAGARAAMLIEYAVNGRCKKLRIVDNTIEGGSWRIGRAAVDVKRLMRAARDLPEQHLSAVVTPPCP